MTTTDPTPAWYLAATARATRLLFPAFPLPDHGQQDPVSSLPTFDGPGQALDWVAAHQSTLLDLIPDPTAQEHDAQALEMGWKLPLALYPVLELTDQSESWLLAHTRGLACARTANHALGQVRNLLGLADATTDPAQALPLYEQVRALAQSSDSWALGFALRRIAELQWQSSQDTVAFGLLRTAQEAFTDAGDRRGQALVLLSSARIQDHLHAPAPWLPVDEGLRLLDGLGDEWTNAHLRLERAQMLTKTQQYDRARADLSAALPVFDAYRDQAGLETVAKTQGHLAKP